MLVDQWEAAAAQDPLQKEKEGELSEVYSSASLRGSDLQKGRIPLEESRCLKKTNSKQPPEKRTGNTGSRGK